MIASGFVASTVAPGAVYASDKLFPNQMEGARKWVAKNIVKPHPQLFVTLSKGLDTAHEKYDQRRREEQIRLGEPVEESIPLTPEEQANAVADTLVVSSVALGADFAATYGLLKLSEKITKTHSHAGKVTFIDAAVTLGSIALMPTAFASISENVHHSLRKMMQKITGMDKNSADKIAISTTYVGIPSLLGTAAGVLGTVFTKR